MAIEFRSITAEEADTFRRAVRAGFGMPLSIDGGELAQLYAEPLDRRRVAMEDGAIRATLASFPTPLTVPGGGELTVGALTAVTSRATHRRLGLLTTLMTTDLQASVDAGEPASILIASEYPIYGRFGFGPAVESTGWELDCRAVRFTNEGEGTVEYVDNETFRKEAPAVFEQVRRERPGMIGRNDVDWDVRADLVRFPEDKAWEGFRLLCRDDRGAATGWANFTQKSDWPDRRPAHTLQVADLCAATPGATARLWRFLAETDLVATVSAEGRPVDEVLPWLLVDARMAKQTHRNDFVWVRPLDVETMLTVRRYWTTDAVVIEVVDPLGFAAGRYRLDVSPEGASCTPTDAAADLTLPARTLGAAYLGGVGASTLAGAGWLDAHTDGAVARFGAVMASPVVPWCNTGF